MTRITDEDSVRLDNLERLYTFYESNRRLFGNYPSSDEACGQCFPPFDGLFSVFGDGLEGSGETEGEGDGDGSGSGWAIWGVGGFGWGAVEGRGYVGPGVPMGTGDGYRLGLVLYRPNSGRSIPYAYVPDPDEPEQPEPDETIRRHWTTP